MSQPNNMPCKDIYRAEKRYTQEEMENAIHQAMAEGFERAKNEDAGLRVKYNALRRMLKDISTVFGEGG